MPTKAGVKRLVEAVLYEAMPCPFCDHRLYVNTVMTDKTKMYMTVKCSTGCVLDTFHFENRIKTSNEGMVDQVEKFLKKWNRRGDNTTMRKYVHQLRLDREHMTNVLALEKARTDATYSNYRVSVQGLIVSMGIFLDTHEITRGLVESFRRLIGMFKSDFPEMEKFISRIEEEIDGAVDID
ncbi:MAG: hypothetical protein SVK08_00395 [Halobacteriota archaeon]|nr:hypothetical protein [Halobacteriota archaeon]